MKIAISQAAPVKGDLQKSIAVAVGELKSAAEKGGRLVVFPECFLTGGCFDDRESLEAAAIDVNNGALSPIIEVCKNKNMYTAIGFYRKLDGKVLNCAAFIGPGGVIDYYYKRHLPFMIGDRFSDIPEDKSPAKVYDTELGKIGIAICYEIRFPEVVRTLALKGADIVLLLAAWPYEAKLLPEVFTKVRAAENFVYLVAANRADAENDVEFMGMSHIVGPDGSVLEYDSDGDLIISNVDVEKARKKSIIRYPGVYEIHPFRDRIPESYLVHMEGNK
ncbi:carbon-nitrogen hydrolase family protein [Halomonas sp. MCCC 1A11036]|uniref:Carbon-nitrogen hydrolase family protein n=1 Tax=Billgrantia zhangzhouensis TaxID=2733481 RepID=A0ABS9A9K9_9GAMM|nr:carbon-nitrogen hydrolase family protein [Halomonas zhangzhouensis]MCE8018588.1 carbon-nitrogen hydrolase family protein [Halomonas zhangzhouensis]